MLTSQFLYLSRADVEAVELPMPEIIDALEVAFRQHGQGKVEMPPKPGVHSRPDAFIHAMPCYIPGPEAIGIKWVAGYPENPKRGLPYITGLLVLNDAETGLPLAVMDCTWITAKRTGGGHGAGGALPGAAELADDRHPGLRRARAQQFRGAQRALPGQTGHGL